MPTRIVYRADQRDFNVIFGGGFSPRHPGGMKIEKGGQMYGGVSTTKDIRVAVHYAALYDGYVYAMVVADGPEAVDMYEAVKRKGGNAGDLTNCRTQMEVACDSIPGTHIIGARKGRLRGNTCEMFGDTHENVACGAEAHLKEMAIMALNSMVSVDKNYKG